MINKYRRAARTASELGLGELAPLDEAIPELRSGGGTGGHLFPAMALAQELRRRGHVIHLMTDERVAGYGDAA